MKYVVWLWRNTKGIRWNTAVRIVVGIIQVALGLTMVWLSRQFIDETILTGSGDDLWRMILLLVATWYWGWRLTRNWAITFRGIGHEDWRYTKYRSLHPLLFQLINLFGLNMVPTLVVFAAMLPGLQLYEAGVAPDLIRLSVGIEDVEDILDDIRQALDKV